MVLKTRSTNRFRFTNRIVNKGAERLLGVEQPVLDKGFVALVDYMGVDETVVAAARTSFDKGFAFDEPERNERLINFLMENGHTSPFEQIALVFEVKAPIFVFREWHRHRTAKLNEMSGRYTQLPNEVYTPTRERIKGQDKVNKQGSSGEVAELHKDIFLHMHECNVNGVFEEYQRSLDNGIAKEVARIDLPLSTYSKMVWQMDLHNLMHFMRLRMAPNAQWEIREYANIIGEIVQRCYPKVWGAFEEHILKAKKLSNSEAMWLLNFLKTCDIDVNDAERPNFDKLMEKLGR